MDRWLALGLSALAAEMTGAAEAGLRGVVEYSKTREAFGVPIGTFQGLQHMAADAYVACEGLRSTNNHASWAVDEEDPADALLAARVVKAYACRQLLGVAETVMQMYGGIGQTWEHIAHFYARRILLDRYLLGDAQTPAGGHRRPAAGAPVGRFVAAGRASRPRTKEERWISATPRNRRTTGPRRGRGCRSTARCRSRAPGLLNGGPLDEVADPEQIEQRHRDWRRLLYDAGYTLQSWPAEWGGGGISPIYDAIFNEEASAVGAPGLRGMYLERVVMMAGHARAAREIRHSHHARGTRLVPGVQRAQRRL